MAKCKCLHHLSQYLSLNKKRRRKIANIKYYAIYAYNIYERCLFDAAFHHRFTNNISHMNQHFVE